MRNRGVEIYMLNYDENPDSGKLDFRCLLNNCGMTKRNHQEALMKIHQRLLQDTSNVDKLSIIQLLHAAFLVVQQLAHGFPVLQAFKSSCVDVYLKARFIYNPETKLRLISIIEDTISVEFDLEEDDEYTVDLDAATCSIKNLQDNSKLTLIKQQGLLMDWCVKEYLMTEKQFPDSDAKVSVKMNFIDEFFNMENKFSNKEVLDILPYVLLNFYEFSALNDAFIRKAWVSNILNQSANLKFLADKNLLLTEDILTLDYEGYDSKMPWGRDFDKANNLALLLYFQVFIINSEIENERKIENSNIITVAQFSEALRQGTMTIKLDDQEHQIMVANYVKFLDQIKTCIYTILKHSVNEIDDTDYVLLRHGLKWFGRFCNLGRMILINQGADDMTNFNNQEEIILILKVHYKWLKKFINELTENYEAHDSSNFQEYHEALIETMNEIDGSLTLVNNPFRKICKLFSKYAKIPLPRTSNTILDIFSQLQSITESFNPMKNRYISKNLINEPKFKILQREDTLKIRSSLISIWHKIYANETIDEGDLSNIVSIKKFCDEYLNVAISENSEDISMDANEIFSSKEVEKIATKIQMWPLHEYTFILFVARLQRILSEKLTEIDTSDSFSSSYPSSYHKKIPNIPVELHAILNAIFTQQNKPEEMNRLIFAFYTWVSKFTENSYAIKSFKQVCCSILMLNVKQLKFFVWL